MRAHCHIISCSSLLSRALYRFSRAAASTICRSFAISPLFSSRRPYWSLSPSCFLSRVCQRGNDRILKQTLSLSLSLARARLPLPTVNIRRRTAATITTAAAATGNTVVAVFAHFRNEASLCCVWLIPARLAIKGPRVVAIAIFQVYGPPDAFLARYLGIVVGIARVCKLERTSIVARFSRILMAFFFFWRGELSYAACHLAFVQRDASAPS